MTKKKDMTVDEWKANVAAIHRGQNPFDPDKKDTDLPREKSKGPEPAPACPGETSGAAAASAPENAIEETQKTAAEASPYDQPIPGEPIPPRIAWDLFECEHPTAEEPQTADKLLREFRRLLDDNNYQASVIRAQRRELARYAGFADDPGESPEAANVKRAMVEALKELMPQATRAAKRGKPALLRLIARTIRTKL